MTYVTKKALKKVTYVFCHGYKCHQIIVTIATFFTSACNRCFVESATLYSNVNQLGKKKFGLKVLQTFEFVTSYFSFSLSYLCILIS